MLSFKWLLSLCPENIRLPSWRLWFFLVLKLTLTFGTEEKTRSQSKNIPLSDNRTKHRYLHNSEDLLKQLFDKLKKAQLFGIKLDETIDISDEGQFILYYRFAHAKTRPFRELLVLCES